MPDNRGNATAYVAGDGHRPLPRADQQTYRAAHQPRDPKPTSTFDWNWNKATCTGCQTSTPKPQLVDDLCPTCRGVEHAAPALLPAPARQHSRSGDQVYIPYDDQQLADRFQAPAVVPAEPDPEPEPTAAAEDLETVEPTASTPQPPSPAVENRQPAEHQPLTSAYLLDLQLDHAVHTLTRAHQVTDPIVGILRSAALSAIAALDLYLELHHQTTHPGSTGLGDEGGQQPARFQTFQKPRRRPTARRPQVDLDERAVVREYTEDLDSMPAIGRRHGVQPKRIRQILLAHHIELRDDRGRLSGGNNRRVWDQATIDDVVRRYTVDEQSMDRIEAATGVERRQVSKILTTAGVPLRPAAHQAHPQLTPEQRAEAVELYLQGHSLVDVGHIYGVRAMTIRDIVTAAGHPVRTKGSSTGTSQRIADLGLTARTIRDWATSAGVEVRPTGLLPASVIDAYEAAHPITQQEGQPA